MTDRAVSPPLFRARFRGDESGAAILEFSLVFVLFVFLIYGLIAYGMILATKQRVTNAAADAAREAVGAASFDNGSPTDAKSRAEKRLQEALGGDGYSWNITNGPCNPLAASSNCITVEVTYDYKNHPIVPVPELPGLHLFTPDTVGSKAVVQWQ